MQHSYLEALLWKNIYHFLERRRNSNVWCRALMQSDCLHSSLFFKHYNRILLCDWVLGRYSVCLRACTCHNTSVLYLDQGWTQCPTLDVVLYQVLRVSEQNSVRKVSATLLFYLQTCYELFCCVCFYQSALCRLCVFVLYALSRVFAKGNVRYPVWTCRVPISPILGT